MKPDQLKGLCIIGIIIGLFIVSTTVPISDKQDAIVKVKVESPADILSPPPKIVSVSTILTPHTYYQLPYLGLIWTGDLVLTATIDGKTDTKTFGKMLQGTTSEQTLIIPDITKSDVTVVLYENNKEIARRVVKLT